MRLRYAGTCRRCGATVAAGEQATYFRAEKQVECLSCHGDAPKLVPTAPVVGRPEPEPEPEPEPVDVGTAGASARREHQRRATRREQKVRAAHPRVGGLLLALTDDPQSTKAWDQGARGEELLAKRLDGLAAHGVLVLHDRRIRGTQANIDHLAISAAGVFVIDAKRYKGRPTLKVEGGLLRPRTETLLVGRRTCTNLLTGIGRQVGLVEKALSDFPLGVAVSGMLCFVEADWPLFGGSFTTSGIDVLGPGKAAEKITRGGPVRPEQAAALHRHLASVFPVA